MKRTTACSGQCEDLIPVPGRADLAACRACGEVQEVGGKSARPGGDWKARRDAEQMHRTDIIRYDSTITVPRLLGVPCPSGKHGQHRMGWVDEEEGLVRCGNCTATFPYPPPGPREAARRELRAAAARREAEHAAAGRELEVWRVRDARHRRWFRRWVAFLVALVVVAYLVLAAYQQQHPGADWSDLWTDVTSRTSQ